MKEILREQVAVQGAADGHCRSAGSVLPMTEEPPKGLKEVVGEQTENFQIPHPKEEPQPTCASKEPWA